MSSSETPWSNHGASASTLGGYSDRRADTTDTTTGIRNRSLALILTLRLVMQCFLPVTSPFLFLALTLTSNSNSTFASTLTLTLLRLSLWLQQEQSVHCLS